ncbi:MAG: hypothetical protein J5J00_16790 [Deltaproteobacteria bacterium]|nr:hypothetical protein [Deltaproteobacteria bacterium]
MRDNKQDRNRKIDQCVIIDPLRIARLRPPGMKLRRLSAKLKAAISVKGPDGRRIFAIEHPW